MLRTTTATMTTSATPTTQPTAMSAVPVEPSEEVAPLSGDEPPHGLAPWHERSLMKAAQYCGHDTDCPLASACSTADCRAAVALISAWYCAKPYDVGM